jgi:capsid protein
MVMFYLLSIVLLCIAWIMAYPQETVDMVAGLRRQFRQKVIQRTGNQAVQELARQLRAEARRMGIPTAIADQVIEEERQEIIDQLGSKYAREILDD